MVSLPASVMLLRAYLRAHIGVGSGCAALAAVCGRFVRSWNGPLCVVHTFMPRHSAAPPI